MNLAPTLRTLMNRPAAAVMAIGGAAVTAATHTAVLANKLPIAAINGGRVQDPVLAQQISIGGLAVQAPVVLLALRGAGVLGQASRAERRIMGGLSVLCVVNLAMQLAGTNFERAVMAPTLAIISAGLARLSLPVRGS